VIRAALFDMDGVLVDAQEIHRRAFAEAVLRVSGIRLSDAEQVRLEGRPTNTKLAMLGVTDPDKARLASALKQALTLAEARKYPRDTTRESALAALRARGVAVACVTNSIRQTTERFLTAAGLFPHIDLIVTNQDVDKPKPHPDGYLLAMQRLGVKPAEAVIFEDSPVGLAAASASGALVCPTTFDTLPAHAALLVTALGAPR
jgi:beta-phosphoglucomutase